MGQLWVQCMRLCNIEVCASDMDKTLFYRNNTQKVVNSKNWETIYHERDLDRHYRGYPVYDAVFRLHIWWGLQTFDECLDYVCRAKMSGCDMMPILPLMYGVAPKIQMHAKLPTKWMHPTKYTTGASSWVKLLEHCSNNRPDHKCWGLVGFDKVRLTLYKDVHITGSDKCPQFKLQNRFKSLTIHGARKYFVRMELFKIVVSELPNNDLNLALSRLAKRCRWADTVMLCHYTACCQKWRSMLGNPHITPKQRKRLLWSYIEGTIMLQTIGKSRAGLPSPQYSSRLLQRVEPKISVRDRPLRRWMMSCALSALLRALLRPITRRFVHSD